MAEFDLVIEATTEDLGLKKRILKQGEDVVHRSAVIASHTSSISITALAATLSDPSRFIGMTFSILFRSFRWSKLFAACKPATWSPTGFAK